VLRGDDEGVVESPQVAGTVSYPNNVHCSWIIEVNETEVNSLNGSKGLLFDVMHIQKVNVTLMILT